MKKKIIILLFAAVFFRACIAICGIAFRCSRTQIHTAINKALREAERLHYEDRLNTFQTDNRLYVDPALKAYLLAPVSNRKIKSYTLQTLEKKTTYVFQDSLPEATARKLLNEYLLDDILPADAEQINQLFQTRAGILPTASAYRTPVYQLDLTHNLQLQGWADYDLLTLLRYVPVAYYGTFFLVLFAGGVLLYLRYKKRQKKPAKGLYIDLTHQVLLIDGIQCAISRLDTDSPSVVEEKWRMCRPEGHPSYLLAA